MLLDGRVTRPLLLIDAPSLYFRAYFGIPESAARAPDGTPVNAVRGFLDMLATFSFATDLLAFGVREHGLLTIEEGVRLLTSVPAAPSPMQQVKYVLGFPSFIFSTPGLSNHLLPGYSEML